MTKEPEPARHVFLPKVGELVKATEWGAWYYNGGGSDVPRRELECGKVLEVTSLYGEAAIMVQHPDYKSPLGFRPGSVEPYMHTIEEEPSLYD